MSLRAAFVLSVAALVISIAAGCRCIPRTFAQKIADAEILGTFKILVKTPPTSCGNGPWGDMVLELVELYKGNCALDAGAQLPGKYIANGEFNGRTCALSCNERKFNVSETYLLALSNGADGVSWNVCDPLIIRASDVTPEEEQNLSSISQCDDDPNECQTSCNDRYLGARDYFCDSHRCTFGLHPDCTQLCQVYTGILSNCLALC